MDAFDSPKRSVFDFLMTLSVHTLSLFFFLKNPAPPKFYPLSLHAPLPISSACQICTRATHACPTISVRPRRTLWRVDQRRLAPIRSVPYARRASGCTPDPRTEDRRGQPKIGRAHV